MNSRKIINKLNENLINDKIIMSCDGLGNISSYNNPKGGAYKTVRRVLCRLVSIKLLTKESKFSKDREAQIQLVTGFLSNNKEEIDEYDIASILNRYNGSSFEINEDSLELLNDILEKEIRKETVYLGNNGSRSLFVVYDRSPFGVDQ